MTLFLYDVLQWSHVLHVFTMVCSFCHILPGSAIHARELLLMLKKFYCNNDSILDRIFYAVPRFYYKQDTFSVSREAQQYCSFIISPWVCKHIRVTWFLLSVCAFAGLSDPLAHISVKDQLFKTKHQEKTLNPEWNLDYELCVRSYFNTRDMW